MIGCDDEIRVSPAGGCCYHLPKRRPPPSSQTSAGMLFGILSFSRVGSEDLWFEVPFLFAIFLLPPFWLLVCLLPFSVSLPSKEKVKRTRNLPWEANVSPQNEFNKCAGTFSLCELALPSCDGLGDPWEGMEYVGIATRFFPCIDNFINYPVNLCFLPSSASMSGSHGPLVFLDSYKDFGYCELK